MILGGTEEAKALAARLVAAGHPVIVSLAGRAAADYPGTVRIGGFGGADGLAAVLRAERITHLLDATHPFAAAISPGAVRAAAMAGIPYLRLERPPWGAEPGDDFVMVKDAEAASAAVPEGARVFLTLGLRGLSPFLARRDLELVVRAIAAPDLEGRADVTVLRARGPFALADERALWAEHGFDALVTKNSGGSDAKLVAARENGALVVMIERPAGQPPADATTVDEMLARLGKG